MTPTTKEPSFVAANVVRLVLRRKWIILGLSVLAGVGGYLYTRTLPDYYKSTINCVPAANDQSLVGGAIGGLGGALKDIGLSKLSKTSGDSYEFIVVLFTRQIRDSMIRRFDLVKQYNLESEPMKAVREAFDENVQVELRAEGNYEISFWSQDPRQSVEMCTAYVAYANQIANDVSRKEALKTTGYLKDRIKLIDSALSAIADSMGYYSKTYLMFSPEDQAKASAVALTQSRTSLLEQQTILGLLERSYGKTDPQTMAQASVVQQLESQYEDLTSKPGFVGNFSLRDAAGIGARYMRLATEFEAHAKLKAFVLPTLEQAQLDQSKSTPSLIVVDDPVPSEKKDRPHRTLIAGGMCIGTGLLVIVLMLIWTAWRDMLRAVSKDA